MMYEGLATVSSRMPFSSLKPMEGLDHNYSARQLHGLSDSLNRSLKWAKSQLYLGGQMLLKRRRPNPWNGYVREQLREENEG
jgi:hypothetical protein